MKTWFRDQRIAILNWLGAGVVKFIAPPPATSTSLSASQVTMSTAPIPAPLTVVWPNTQAQTMIKNSTINFNVTKANGGWIIQISPQDGLNSYITGVTKPPELYIINDDADFDKELGKIVMTVCLKA